MYLKALLVLLLFSFKAMAQNNVYVHSNKVNNELPFLFFADNQTNNILINPTIFRTLLTDQFVSVAIRPPRLDLFSPDMFESIIRGPGRGKFLIHLGDGLNTACQNEWRTFSSRIRPLKNGKKEFNGWVMAPGNHDFFYLGNTSAGGSRFERNIFEKMWFESCYDVGFPAIKSNDLPTIKNYIMTKDSFIRNYLKEIFFQAGLFPDQFPISQNKLKCSQTKQNTTACFFESPNKNSFFQKIYYELPNDPSISESYKSLLVQELYLGTYPPSNIKVRAILIDTSDYENNPRLTGVTKISARSERVNPGVFGSMNPRQEEEIENWINSYKKSEGDDNTLYLIAGHHPFDNLTPGGKENVKKLFSKIKNYVYVSAHTHKGWEKNSPLNSEINVGSTTDYPSQYTKIGLPKMNKGKIILDVERKFILLNPANFPFYQCTKFEDSSFNALEKKLGLSYTDYKSAKYGRSIFSKDTTHAYTLEVLLFGYKKMLTDLKLNNPEVNKMISLAAEGIVLADCLGKKGAMNQDCRSERFQILKKVMIMDEDFMNKNLAYRNLRIDYGTCQTIFSNHAEFETKKK